MTPYFSLWDVKSGNLIEDFDLSDAAMRLAADLIAGYGEEYADRIELSWTSGQDETQLIATGPALVALVRGRASRRPGRRSPVALRRRLLARERIAS